MKEISKAIVNVMNEVKNIEKSMTVGTGSYSYQGVSDKVVKEILQPAMAKHGLCIIPSGVTAQTKTERWDEGGKVKQSTFTEVTTKYTLLHTSGETLELSGYGHGIDTQDKGAGKATTYALKYALLYLFLIPTGKIDDTDAEHSEEAEVPHLPTIRR